MVEFIIVWCFADGLALAPDVCHVLINSALKPYFNSPYIECGSKPAIRRDYKIGSIPKIV